MSTSAPTQILAHLEQLIRRDPAQRGLIGSEALFGPLCPGHLAGAAAELSQTARSVGIVTGFYIPGGQPPAAETDGPLGALTLAAVLERLEIETWVITDPHCHAALATAATLMGLSEDRILDVVFGDDDGGDAFFDSSPGNRMSHLIAIERVGPSHTASSLAAQRRTAAAPMQEFGEQVPLACRDRCHNMRGEAIDAYGGNLHRLFEAATVVTGAVKTIGVGDGANEIGMGSIPWEDLRRRLEGDHAGIIPCRISTDWTIVAGTSNWGGYALAAAVAHLKDAAHAFEPFDAMHQLRILERLVQHGPAVDGVTRRQEATVDGLPFATYIQPLDAMRQALGLI